MPVPSTCEVRKNLLGDYLGSRGGKCPAQVAVAGVVVDAGAFATLNDGDHVGHHGPKAGPWHGVFGLDVGEEVLDPFHKRAHAVIADVPVVAVEFGCSGDAEAVFAKAAGHDFGFVVQKADPRGRFPACFVVEFHGDGVALHRVDVDAVAEDFAELAAADTGADDDAIKGRIVAEFLGVLPCHDVAAVLLGDLGHIGVEVEVDALFAASLGQAPAVEVDVAGCVGGRVIAAVEVAFDCGL